MITGRCECNKVSFEVEAVRDTVTVCHCSQCRRTSGHVWASTVAPFDSVRFIKTDGLEWYASSDFARRGFCKFCGSSLFYQFNGEEKLAIAAGCLDQTEGMSVGKNIFVKDKASYYRIREDEPQIERF